jgi:hypothetical protein
MVTCTGSERTTEMVWLNPRESGFVWTWTRNALIGPFGLWVWQLHSNARAAASAK